MTPPAARERKTKPVFLALDRDAEALLRAMVSGHGLGLLVSELIRKEAREREGRPAQLERLRAASGAGEKT